MSTTALDSLRSKKPHGEAVTAFFTEALAALEAKPDQAASLILSKLNHHLSLRGASFYTYVPYTKAIVLKEQIGFDYSAYQSLCKPATTNLAGQALLQRQVLCIEDLTTLSSVQESKLIEDYGLKSGIALPLVNSEDNKELYDRQYGLVSEELGVICLYPQPETNLDSLHLFAECIQPFLSRLYRYATVFFQLRLQQPVIERAHVSRDLNSFLFRALQIITSSLNIEAASIFLWHDKSKLLRLHSTTGLETDLQKHDIFYRPDEDQITVAVAETGEPYVSDNISHDHPKGRFIERVASVRASFIAIPIPNWTLGVSRKTRPIGTLRAVNKYFSFVGRKEVVPFAWEDISSLFRLSESISVIANIFKKCEEKMTDFERVLHGARSNIEAVIQNLSHFETRPEVLQCKDPRYDYIIPDSISHMLDIKWQIERMLKWQFERIESGEVVENITKVKLYGSVLSKVVNLVPKLTRTFGVNRVEISDLREQHFDQLPYVRGNVEALMTVFRNLVENAIKYSDPKSPACKIDLTYETEGEYLRVLVSDNGIGIEEEDAKWIFVEGFRGENAIRRRPAGGSGIGLPQSQKLMQQMDGDLWLENHRPTTFAVRLRKWSDDPKENTER